MKKIKKIIKSALRHLGYDLDCERRLKHYRNFLSYGFATILDIGANVGQFSREMLDTFPDAHIYAFEPVAGCYEKLKKVSDKLNFHPLPYALGNQTGETTINVSSYDPSSSILPMSDLHKKLFPHTAGGHAETIQIRRLDDITGGIDFKLPLLIKMDVQGYEKEVVLGGSETFKKASVVLSETSFASLYAGQPLADEMRDLLGEFGFEYRGALNNKKHPQTGEVLFEDSVFVKIAMGKQ
ncbi:MAG: FkbM family methyltransferase [Candidatus Yanofskybacteria bacterium]|nr:FkbM family methyltransferase [Candidatus Yanofskybacteria bacterium]